MQQRNRVRGGAAASSTSSSSSSTPRRRSSGSSRSSTCSSSSAASSRPSASTSLLVTANNRPVSLTCILRHVQGKGAQQTVRGYICIREVHTKLLEHLPKYCHRSEQSTRSSIRQDLEKLDFDPVKAVASEIAVLKAAGILQANAPGASLYSVQQSAVYLRRVEGMKEESERLKMSWEQFVSNEGVQAAEEDEEDEAENDAAAFAIGGYEEKDAIPRLHDDSLHGKKRKSPQKDRIVSMYQSPSRSTPTKKNNSTQQQRNKQRNKKKAKMQEEDDGEYKRQMMRDDGDEEAESAAEDDDEDSGQSSNDEAEEAEEEEEGYDVDDSNVLSHANTDTDVSLTDAPPALPLVQLSSSSTATDVDEAMPPAALSPMMHSQAQPLSSARTIVFQQQQHSPQQQFHHAHQHQMQHQSHSHQPPRHALFPPRPPRIQTAPLVNNDRWMPFRRVDDAVGGGSIASSGLNGAVTGNNSTMMMQTLRSPPAPQSPLFYPTSSSASTQHLRHPSRTFDPLNLSSPLSGGGLGGAGGGGLAPFSYSSASAAAAAAVSRSHARTTSLLPSGFVQEKEINAAWNAANVGAAQVQLNTNNIPSPLTTSIFSTNTAAGSLHRQQINSFDPIKIVTNPHSLLTTQQQQQQQQQQHFSFQPQLPRSNQVHVMRSNPSSSMLPSSLLSPCSPLPPGLLSPPNFPSLSIMHSTSHNAPTMMNDTTMPAGSPFQDITNTGPPYYRNRVVVKTEEVVVNGANGINSIAMGGGNILSSKHERHGSFMFAASSPTFSSSPLSHMFSSSPRLLASPSPLSLHPPLLQRGLSLGSLPLASSSSINHIHSGNAPAAAHNENETTLTANRRRSLSDSDALGTTIAMSHLLTAVERETIKPN